MTTICSKMLDDWNNYILPKIYHKIIAFYMKVITFAMSFFFLSALNEKNQKLLVIYQLKYSITTARVKRCLVILTSMSFMLYVWCCHLPGKKSYKTALNPGEMYPQQVLSQGYYLKPQPQNKVKSHNPSNCWPNTLQTMHTKCILGRIQGKIWD